MEKKRAILALVLVLSTTMNTACNDKESRRVPVTGETSVETAVETQSVEMKTVVAAKIDLDDSIEALAKSEAALNEEQDIRDDIQDAMEAEPKNIPVLNSDLKESNAKIHGLAKETMLRADAVADKRVILNTSLNELTVEELANLDVAIATGEATVSENDMEIARNTLGYEAAAKFISSITEDVQEETRVIEAKQQEMEWAISQGAPRIEAENAFGEDISRMIAQREKNLKVMAVFAVMQENFAKGLRTALSK
jgi:hypothetical protein